MKKEIDIYEEVSYHDYTSPKYLEVLFLLCWIKNSYKTSKAVMNWNYTLKLHIQLPCDTGGEIQKRNGKDSRHFLSIFKELVSLVLEDTGRSEVSQWLFEPFIACMKGSVLGYIKSAELRRKVKSSPRLCLEPVIPDTPIEQPQSF